MTHSNTPWPAYDWTGKIVVVTGGAGSHSVGRIAEPTSGGPRPEAFQKKWPAMV